VNPSTKQIDFTLAPEQVARQLIGAFFYVDGVGGRIVETEAYDENDPASHSFRGRSARNVAMFGPPGRAYVYLSYGLHWCLNFVCREEGRGAAVLLRALEPTAGIRAMEDRRRMSERHRLCAGPGRVGQALAISKLHDGRPLNRPPFLLTPRDQDFPIVSNKRIGISRGQDVLWRFELAGSSFVSRSSREPTRALQSQ
jgi:DNA-3-methyladenine glycosylase